MKIYAEHFACVNGHKRPKAIHGEKANLLRHRLFDETAAADSPFKLPSVTMKMIIMVYLERLRNSKKVFFPPLNRRDDDV